MTTEHTHQHTPGPWTASNTADVYGKTVGVQCKRTVAKVRFSGDIDQISITEAEANARLIAAAPELLGELDRQSFCLAELCKLVLRGQYETAKNWAESNAEKLASDSNEVIAKATGQPAWLA